MLLRKVFALSALFAGTCAAVGCLTQPGKVHYLGDADLKYYKGKATNVDVTPNTQNVNEDAVSTAAPRTVTELHKDQLWDITLAETIQIALANNRIIRRAVAETLDPSGNNIYSSNINAPSVYDPAIQESGVLFGGRGVEAALADFDTQFATSMVWGRDEQISNVRQSALGPGPTIVSETGTFRSQLSKTTAYGGTVSLNHNWDYLWQNTPGRLFPSAYTGTLSAGYRQPLWAGSGVEYTRIAGPINPNFGGITGVSQGVVIARINQDISIADFEANVRSMLKDVEDAYWDLYLAYQTYDIQVRIRNLALRVWRDEKIRTAAGAGDLSGLAEAHDAYFERKASVDSALSTIYSRELLLRRLCCLKVNDCRIMRPCDEPTSAEFIPDWCASLAEALTHRVELRRQKWNIKSLQLQLIAARGLTNPQFDFVSNYRVNGFGDKLFGENDQDGVTDKGLNSAYERLTENDETGWNLGFEFSMPIGFRSARTQVRNIELRLAKARDVLATEELEVSYDLARTFQDLAVNYETAQDNFNRRVAATERIRILTTQVELGAGNKGDLINRLLQAQTSFGTAETNYFNSLVTYNKAMTNYYFRKGLLLEHNNVHIGESSWKPEAYREALRRAWARSHAFPNPLLGSEPTEFSRRYKEGDPHASDGNPGSGVNPNGPKKDEGDAPELAPPPAPTDPKDDRPQPPKPNDPEAATRSLRGIRTTSTERSWDDRPSLRVAEADERPSGRTIGGWENRLGASRAATTKRAAESRMVPEEDDPEIQPASGTRSSRNSYPEDDDEAVGRARPTSTRDNPGLGKSSTGAPGGWTLQKAFKSHFSDEAPESDE